MALRFNPLSNARGVATTLLFFCPLVQGFNPLSEAGALRP